ncbi:MAG: DUF1294 domain-containing protein [Planctomycetota bacterium]|nr:DUF1294 domain-containing protein [Planctomycetota bacterium]
MIGWTPASGAGWWLLAVWIALCCVLTFAAHVVDKRAAIRGRRRIPEARLHLLELLGGWPGALLAMTLVRHKTRKVSYLAGLAVVVAAWVVVAWFVLRPIWSGPT